MDELGFGKQVNKFKKKKFKLTMFWGKIWYLDCLEKKFVNSMRVKLFS